MPSTKTPSRKKTVILQHAALETLPESPTPVSKRTTTGKASSVKDQKRAKVPTLPSPSISNVGQLSGGGSIAQKPRDFLLKSAISEEEDEIENRSDTSVPPRKRGRPAKSPTTRKRSHADESEAADECGFYVSLSLTVLSVLNAILTVSVFRITRDS